jgi:hypothetical protein
VLRPHDRSRCDEHGESCSKYFGEGVHAPPVVVMVAPQTLMRNAEGAQSEGRAQQEGFQKSAARGIIEAETRVAEEGLRASGRGGARNY